MRGLVAVLALLVAPVWAGDLEPAVGLSMQFFCQASEVLESNVGLLIGFLIAAYGLWKIIGGAMKMGLVWIVAGALLTALPSVVMSTFDGMSAFLRAQGISDGQRDVGAFINYARGMKGHCEDLADMIDWSEYNAQQARQGMPSFQVEQQAARSGAMTPGRVDPNAATGQPGCTNLAKGGRSTSPFGWRIHPITGQRKLHGGVDVAAPAGSEIYAAASGTVIKASWGGGAGNMVTIDHGGGKTTNYFHMQGFQTSVGASVSAGQVIGYVGSTGMSTGPHLHFEVRQNGTPIDPVANGCGAGGGGRLGGSV